MRLGFIKDLCSLSWGKENRSKYFIINDLLAVFRKSLLISPKVCSNYINPVGLFYAFFRLTDFSTDPLDFSFSETVKEGIKVSDSLATD